MTGESGATPDLDAEGLLASIPSLADHDGLQAQTVTNLPERPPDARRPAADLPPGARRGPARDRRRRHPRHRHARGDGDALRRRPRRRGPDRLHRRDPPGLRAGRRRAGQRRRRGQRRRQRRRRRDGRAGLLRRRDPPRALRAQDRHDLARRLLLAADRAARPGHRGPPDDLVADPAQPAARPAAPRRPRAGRSAPAPATTARWPAPPSTPSPRASSSARSAPGTWRRPCSSSGPRPPSGSPWSPTAGPSAA